jgi:two-component system NtrC family sensor kinase
VLEETIALRDYDLKVNHIAVEKDLGDKPAMVVADPHQIEQVFLNISITPWTQFWKPGGLAS